MLTSGKKSLPGLRNLAKLSHSVAPVVHMIDNSTIKLSFMTLIDFHLQMNWYLSQGLLYRWTEHSADFFKMTTGGGKKAPQITPRGGFFEPRSFKILKNSHQDLSNEGSNFILSSLEVGH